MFTDMQKRIFLFLIGCIGVRSILVYVAKTINIKYLPVAGMLALLPAIGFSYLFLFGKRKTGPEVFGGTIWWNNLRPVHALLYFAFAVSAILKKSWSWLFLLVDVVIGLKSFLVYHISQGDF